MKARFFRWELYNKVSEKLVSIARQEGLLSECFASKWACQQGEENSTPALKARLKLVHEMHEQLLKRKDEVLFASYGPFEEKSEGHFEVQSHYMRVKRQFMEQEGDEDRFLKLYHKQYIRALSHLMCLKPKRGEALLVEEKLSHIPFEVSKASASKLAKVPLSREDEKLLNTPFPDGKEFSSLGEQLRTIAVETLDLLNVGAIFATRFHYFNNFALLGTAAWEAVLSAELCLGEQRAEQSFPASDIRHLQDLLAMFIQAHLYNPYDKKRWYGQAYSYLVRDIIDLSLKLFKALDKEPPSFLAFEKQGRFQEYAHVGGRGKYSKLGKGLKLTRGFFNDRRFGKKRLALSRQPDTPTRRLKAWKSSLRWGKKICVLAGIKTTCTFHPRLKEALRVLKAHREGKGMLFLPTHQSLVDHPLVYTAFSSKALRDALGWKDAIACTMVARENLGNTFKFEFGSFQSNSFGIPGDKFDHLLETIDKHIIIDSHSQKSITEAIKQSLDRGPVVIYPMGTATTFATHLFPLQHALFAHIPYNTLLIPMALRGAHSIWPKCPKGNLNIRPGEVEVFFGQPFHAENILFPKQSKLRLQLDIASFFQGVQIKDSLNPQIQ